MGLWAAVLAWGQRATIIKKSRELISLMDGATYDFIRNHREEDLKPFLAFRHRTFNPTDALYFIAFFREFYNRHRSLEEGFKGSTVEEGLINFRKLFCSLPDFPARTAKHISSPESGSTCKRLNMFLRWMVRKDNRGVDFGIWDAFSPAQLICPMDLHVERVARKLGLIKRKQSDWKTALELTETLRRFDPEDPVKYDFALFGLGIMEGEG